MSRKDLIQPFEDVWQVSTLWTQRGGEGGETRNGVSGLPELNFNWFFFFLIPCEIDLGERNVKISYVFLTYMFPSLLQGTSIRMNPNSPTHTREEQVPDFLPLLPSFPNPKVITRILLGRMWNLASECPLAFFRFVPNPDIPHHKLLEESISFPCPSALNFSPGRSPGRARWSPKVKVPITFQCDCFFLNTFPY